MSRTLESIMHDKPKSYPQKEEWYLHFDERIRFLVKVLHSFGVWTIWSCEGHIRTSPIHDGILPWPWVVVQGALNEIEELEQALGEWNSSNPKRKWILSRRRIHGSLTPEYIRHTYSGFVIALTPEYENLDLSPDILAELQNSANELANFLESKMKV